MSHAVLMAGLLCRHCLRAYLPGSFALDRVSTQKVQLHRHVALHGTHTVLCADGLLPRARFQRLHACNAICTRSLSPLHRQAAQWTMCDRKAAVARPWRLPIDSHLLGAFTGGLWLQAGRRTQQSNLWTDAEGVLEALPLIGVWGAPHQPSGRDAACRTGGSAHSP